jgi:hypothetical protein
VEVGIEIVGETDGEGWMVIGSSMSEGPEHEANRMASIKSPNETCCSFLILFGISIFRSNLV